MAQRPTLSPLAVAARALQRCAEDHADDADQGRAVLVVLAQSLRPQIVTDLLDAADTAGSEHLTVDAIAYDALIGAVRIAA